MGLNPDNTTIGYFGVMMESKDNNQNDIIDSVIRGLNEAIEFENGVGSARVDYVQLRQDMKGAR